MPEAESNDVPQYLQENEVSQECKEIIATIPMEKGWVASHLHQYQGFWHTTRQLQGVLSCQNHFQANDSDILIVSTPKSGTTWLKAWTFALLNRHNPNMTQNHPLLTHNPHFLVPFLELDLYINSHTHDNSLPNLTSYSSPRLFSTHIPFISLPNSVAKSSCKIVYLCRDPKDAFISLWHFTNRLRPDSRCSASLDEAFEKFCRGVSLYGPFWDHVSGYWHANFQYPDRIMLIKFEDMKSKAGLMLKQVAEFVGCPISKEEEEEGVVERILELCSFEKLSNLKVNMNGKLESGEEHKAFFRRGEIGDWKNHLTEEMIHKLDSITEEKLGQHGFMF